LFVSLYFFIYDFVLYNFVYNFLFIMMIIYVIVIVYIYFEFFSFPNNISLGVNLVIRLMELLYAIIAIFTLF